MKTLTFSEINQVVGANYFNDALICFGSAIAVGATDGGALLLGAGAVMVGSCGNLLDETP